MGLLNLYKISQNVNNDYDTYDSAIVAAGSVEEARLIHPGWQEKWGERFTPWAYKPEDVQVELIGTAAPGTQAGVILASFNAG